MKPREKAIHLVKTFRMYIEKESGYSTNEETEKAKDCALFCVDEILNNFDDDTDYWEEVKSQIH